MSYMEELRQEKEELRERYGLAEERIEKVLSGEANVEEAYKGYFMAAAKFLSLVGKAAKLVEDGLMGPAGDGCGERLSLEELEDLNRALYEELREENYKTSYGNPAFAVKEFGEEIGQMLSFLYKEIRDTIDSAFGGRCFEQVIVMELFLEVLSLFQEGEGEEALIKSVKSAIYYYKCDYQEERGKRAARRGIDPEVHERQKRIIMEADLSDLSYLYFFGKYIGENEKKTALYLNKQPQEKIDAMARTYTEGFRIGYINGRLDLSKKSVVDVRYFIGFERVARAAIIQFEEMGLKPVLSVSSTSPNRQYEYDHRYDQALYFNKTFVDRHLEGARQGFEARKELAGQYGGPAVMEVFGEIPFSPENKAESLRLSEKQQKLDVEHKRDYRILTNQYLKPEERSFTIIAYPTPEIGGDYEEIFDETIKVNTLDMDLYRDVQEKMIAALDQGEYVRITGRGENRTDLKVALKELSDPEKETLFENCLADVNIPVGEVFTSPKLAGTEGTLHVTEVFLKGLQYRDVDLTFQDGRITAYTCGNFDKEEDNKNYIKENLLQQHDTLPLGEFAIGTNTTAYVMGKKYQISDRLPILIAEKTGPHFAIGDTCFPMSEDVKTYNPDGKEMVAKENEFSKLRKTEIEKAYFNCHTDITIPYNELDSITVHTKAGEEIAIISGGRFALPGTEALNQPLDEFEK